MIAPFTPALKEIAADNRDLVTARGSAIPIEIQIGRAHVAVERTVRIGVLNGTGKERGGDLDTEFLADV